MGCGQSSELNDYNAKNLDKQHTINPHDLDHSSSKNGFDYDGFLNSKKSYTQIKKTYKVLDKIGNGSFGKVFKVFHVPSNQNRAMKVVKKEATKQQDDDKKFLKEIQILAKLDHPNILKILEYFFDENHYYVVTDLVNGGELFDHIQKDKNFSEEKACMIMEQLLSAVGYLHKVGILHRDLKLENILVDTNEDDYFQIKIIDFGASNFFKKNMSLKLKIGTPYYIAPEVLNKNYSYKCDIWSCGVIMYILLCGSPPFDGNTDQEIMDKVKIGQFDFKKKIWESISQEAKSLIGDLLRLDPAKRLTADAAMAHPWMTKFKTKKENQNVIKIERINTFQPKHKFQQTTIAFLVHQMSSQKTNDNLRRIFNEMDTRKNGRLKYEDLKDGLRKYSELHFSDEEFENLLKILDNDGNGYIEYEEFLRATMNMDSLLTENNLKMAFSFFDTDNSGKLSADELQKILGVMNGNNEDKDGYHIIEKIINDLGSDDGLISYDDFKKIMKDALSEIIIS